MLKHDDPVTRSLALLIQLFGRDVVDRIREAGFDNPIAIARAGPETVAARVEIALPLARRIVAVAMETEGVGDLPDPTAPAPETRAPRARRRGVASPSGPGPSASAQASSAPSAPGPSDSTPAASAPAALAGPAPAGARPARERKRPGRGGGPAPGTPGEPETAPIRAASGNPPPEDSDPFVDDAALISWMGFNARSGLPRTTSIAVADAILDPPAKAEPGKGEAASAPPVASDPRTASNSPATSDSTAATRRATMTTMPGSFWSFGRRRPGADGGHDGR